MDVKRWTIKKAQCGRINAFKLWCWRRLWTARRSNQSIIKEIKPEYSLEGQMLKLKLQYSSHLMWKADSLEKTLMLGKIEGRRRERQNEVIRWHHQHNWHELWSCSNLSKVQEIVKNKEAWHAAIHGITKLDTTVTEQHHQPIPLLSENQSL